MFSFFNSHDDTVYPASFHTYAPLPGQFCRHKIQQQLWPFSPGSLTIRLMVMSPSSISGTSCSRLLENKLSVLGDDMRHVVAHFHLLMTARILITFSNKIAFDHIGSWQYQFVV